MDDSNEKFKEKSSPWGGFLFSPFYSAASIAAEATIEPPLSISIPEHDRVDSGNELVENLKKSKKSKKARRAARKAKIEASSSSSELSSVSITPPMVSIDNSVEVVDVISIDEAGEREKYQALEEKLWSERIDREISQSASRELLEADFIEIKRLSTILLSQQEQIETLQKKLEELQENSDRALEAVNKEYEDVTGELVIKRQQLSLQEIEREIKAREESDTIRLLEEQARTLILDSQELARYKLSEEAQAAIAIQEQHILYLRREAERCGL
jgi:hypothetical protein